jgi:hypothetical protein
MMKKIRLSENQLVEFIKNILEQFELPESPAMRFYKMLLEKGYLNENSEVDLDTDVIQIYSMPYGTPEEYFTQYDGYLIILVPYLFEDEGGVEIQFEDENTEEVVDARNEVKDYIAANWDFNFPIDFDDDYLYTDI